MFHPPRVSRLLVFVALLVLSALILTACADGLSDENVVVVEEPGDAVDEVAVGEIEAGEIEAGDIEEPSVEEALEAREEGEPPGEVFETVEPVGEPAVEGIEEQVEEQIDTLGETVTLSGSIVEVLGERTFVFAPSTDAEPILVIFVGDALPSVELSAESTVTLTGAVVAAFYIEDVEKETGLDLEDNLLATYEGGSAFVAISVATPE